MLPVSDSIIKSIVPSGVNVAFVTRRLAGASIRRRGSPRGSMASPSGQAKRGIARVRWDSAHCPQDSRIGHLCAMRLPGFIRPESGTFIIFFISFRIAALKFLGRPPLMPMNRMKPALVYLGTRSHTTQNRLFSSWQPGGARFAVLISLRSYKWLLLTPTRFP